MHVFTVCFEYYMSKILLRMLTCTVQYNNRTNLVLFKIEVPGAFFTRFESNSVLSNVPTTLKLTSDFKCRVMISILITRPLPLHLSHFNMPVPLQSVHFI